MTRAPMGYTIYWTQKQLDANAMERLRNLLQRVMNPARVAVSARDDALVVADREGRGESFVAYRNHAGWRFCKTYRDPYTADIMRACICLYEVNGCYDISADDVPEQFLAELEAVHALSPLTTYEEQRGYFRRLCRPAVAAAEVNRNAILNVVPVPNPNIPRPVPTDNNANYLEDLRTTVRALEARLASLERSQQG
jgi:hypothetical protein